MKKLTLLPLCALVLASCTSLSPHFDREVELAVRTAKAQQIINPDASRNTDPVAGIDGKAADSAIDEYHKSFVAPPPTFNVINVTGG